MESIFTLEVYERNLRTTDFESGRGAPLEKITVGTVIYWTHDWITGGKREFSEGG